MKVFNTQIYVKDDDNYSYTFNYPVHVEVTSTTIKMGDYTYRIEDFEVLIKASKLLEAKSGD